MGIVRRYGKPDVFTTMTCNPKWPEITAALKPCQQPNDRPDLVARVFKMKLDDREMQLSYPILSYPCAP